MSQLISKKSKQGENSFIRRRWDLASRKFCLTSHLTFNRKKHAGHTWRRATQNKIEFLSSKNTPHTHVIISIKLHVTLYAAHNTYHMLCCTQPLFKYTLHTQNYIPHTHIVISLNHISYTRLRAAQRNWFFFSKCAPLTHVIIFLNFILYIILRAVQFFFWKYTTHTHTL